MTSFEEALGLKPGAFNCLYILLDYQTLINKKLILDDFIALCKKKDIKLIQYRDKINNLEIQKNNLLYLKSKLNIPIIINDKIELINYADGIHLGQEDIIKIHKDKNKAIKIIRKIIKNKYFGISTHNSFEILEANAFPIDMIGLGAYRNTNTKEVSNILGKKISYLSKLSKHSVCAIGGVKMNDKIPNVKFNVVGSNFYEN